MILKLSSIAVIMPLVLVLVISPTSQQLWGASDAMCSGYTDFAFTVDVAGSANWVKIPVSNATDGTRGWQRPESEDVGFNERLLNEVLAWPDASWECPYSSCRDAENVTNAPPPGNLSMTGIPSCCWVREFQWHSADEGAFSLRNVGSMGVAEFTESFTAECTEGYMTFGGEKFQYVRPYTTFSESVRGDPDVSIDTCSPTCADPYRPWCRNGTCVTPTCDDVRPYCNFTSRLGQIARMICPSTCGCQNPGSGQMSSLASSGCAASCASHPTYESNNNLTECRDMTTNDTALMQYADGWLNHSDTGTIGNFKMLQLGNIAAGLTRTYGCAWITSKQLSGQLLASKCGSLSQTTGRENGPFNAPIRGLQYYCPVSCECSSANSWGCPQQCLV